MKTPPFPVVAVLSAALVALGSEPFPVVAQSKSGPWAGFYDPATLDYVAKTTAPDIKDHYTKYIWPALNPQERQTLQGVTFAFDTEYPDQAMNFFAHQNKVVLPLSSLRFLRDVCLALAYANRKGYSENVVSNYLSILKYQWPAGSLRKKRYRFEEALGIPANALEDKEVDKQFGSLYTTALHFIICHELGHLRFRHRGYEGVADANAQLQEKQADAFALDVLRRMGNPPFHGIITLFFTLSLVEAYPDEVNSAKRHTHPLTSDRIQAVADNVENTRWEYARQQPEPKKAAQVFLSAADELRTIARILSNGGALDMIRINGQTGDLDRIGFPTKKRPARAADTPIPKTALTGTFAGEWYNERKREKLSITFVLAQKNGAIVGNGRVFDAGTDGVTFRISNGQVEGQTLYFAWDMGRQYFGEGKLTRQADGRLSGTWGTKQASRIDPMGSLELRKKN